MSAPKEARPSSGSADLVAAVLARLSEAGVQSDDPIVPIVVGLAELGDATRGHAVAFTEAVAAFEGAAREDRLRMRQAAERCNAETLKLEKVFGTMEIRAHNMVTQVIETMADQVADKMRDRMVIVEREYNRHALWRRAGVLLAAVLVIFGVGCGVMRYADRHAVGLWNHCIENAYTDPKTGGQWCNVGAPLGSQ